MKHCTKCGEELAETSFYVRTDRNGMLMPWCKKCHNRITNTNRAKRKMTNKEDE